jgi:hypothetical protein
LRRIPNSFCRLFEEIAYLAEVIEAVLCGNLQQALVIDSPLRIVARINPCFCQTMGEFDAAPVGERGMVGKDT